ncbi:MAG: hypothetical protein QXM31_01695 [Candidatus Woesearchaeota archaeon]
MTTKEIGELEREYKAGDMEWIRKPLAEKIQKYSEMILGEAAKLKKKHPSLNDDTCLEIAVNHFFIKHKTVDPAQEIKHQVEEIKLEIYYRQTDAGRELDHEEIIKQWRLWHSEFWRDHNIMRIIYFFEQNKQAYLDILRQVKARQADPKSM